MKATYKIFLRTDFPKKDGTSTIYLRITINRQIKKYSLCVSCHENHWNSNKSEVKQNAPNSSKINLIIESAKTRANKIIFEYLVNNKLLTFYDFEREFKAPSFKSNSFYDYLNYSIKEKENELAFDTTRSHTTQLTKLQKFRPGLSFDEISNHFFDSYKQYMLKELGNNKNTIYKSLSFIKAMLNRAINDGVIKINSVRDYKIGKASGNRNYLSFEELKELEKLLNGNISKASKNVLRYYLFACYTGLRYKDIKELKYKNIIDNMIVLIMHKTKKRVTIPLLKDAKLLISNGFSEQLVFRVYSNQVTNRYLKSIIKDSPINKSISFHCARHTFATVCLEKNIPLEYVSNLLGHSDLKTTQIYARILDHKKIEEMKKWEIE